MPSKKTPSRWILYTLSFLILSLSIFTIFGDRGALHLWRLRDEKIQLDEKNYLIQRENEALRARISRLRNDDTYLEQLAREDLNLVRPGEVIYRFPPAQPKEGAARLFSATRPESRRSAGQKERR